MLTVYGIKQVLNVIVCKFLVRWFGLILRDRLREFQFYLFICLRLSTFLSENRHENSTFNVGLCLSVVLRIMLD